MKIAFIVFMFLIVVVLGIAWIALVFTKIERDFWNIFEWLCYSVFVYIVLHLWMALLVKWIEEE